MAVYLDNDSGSKWGENSAQESTKEHPTKHWGKRLSRTQQASAPKADQNLRFFLNNSENSLSSFARAIWFCEDGGNLRVLRATYAREKEQRANMFAGREESANYGGQMQFHHFEQAANFNQFPSGTSNEAHFERQHTSNDSTGSWSPLTSSPISSSEGLYQNDMRNNFMDIIKMESLTDSFGRKSKKHGRPGRKAKRADCELSDMELAKRELRRERNKEAARRCRQRRLDKTRGLEDQVSDLQLENGHLEYENERLRKQIETLRFHLETFCNGGQQQHNLKMAFDSERRGGVQRGQGQGHLQFNQSGYSMPLSSTRIVSKTPSGARKEVSLEKKEQTIFMNL